MFGQLVCYIFAASAFLHFLGVTTGIDSVGTRPLANTHTNRIGVEVVHSGASFLAEILVSSPRKIFRYII